MNAKKDEIPFPFTWKAEWFSLVPRREEIGNIANLQLHLCIAGSLITNAHCPFVHYPWAGDEPSLSLFLSSRPHVEQYHTPGRFVEKVFYRTQACVIYSFEVLFLDKLQGIYNSSICDVFLSFWKVI